MPLYEVKRPGERGLRLKARDAADAKRQYCRLLGLRPSDPWTGVAYLSARRVTERGWKR